MEIYTAPYLINYNKIVLVPESVQKCKVFIDLKNGQTCCFRFSPKWF